jgi:hypothetical protein
MTSTSESAAVAGALRRLDKHTDAIGLPINMDFTDQLTCC